MKRCETCEEDFYSDTAFNEHQLQHTMDKVLASISDPKRNQPFERAAVMLEYLVVLEIQKNEGITIEVAIERYFTFLTLWHRKVTEFNERIGKSPTV